MVKRYDRHPHPEGPFNADRVADSDPPDAEALRAFQTHMRMRAQERGMLFVAALAVAAVLVLATRNEPQLAAFMNASEEALGVGLLGLAIGAVVLWGYTLYQLMDPLFTDLLGAHGDLQVIDPSTPEYRRVLVVAALSHQEATGYVRALLEGCDRGVRIGDLRALRQYLRQIRNPALGGPPPGPPTTPEDDWARGYIVWSERSYRFFLDEIDMLDYIEFLDGDLAGVAIYFGRPGEAQFPYQVTNCPDEVWRDLGGRRGVEARIDEELEEVLEIFGGWGQELVVT
ncbi:MAG: hypothetical protein ACLFSI_02235 [Halorhodospira sp.]